MIPSSRKAFCRLMAVLLPLVTLSACATEAPADTAAADSVKAVVRDLSATEVHQMIQENPEVLIIDVRTPVEYNAPGGHMPGAQLKPLQEIQTWAPTLASYRDQQIILVCRSGNQTDNPGGLVIGCLNRETEAATADDGAADHLRGLRPADRTHLGDRIDDDSEPAEDQRDQSDIVEKLDDSRRNEIAETEQKHGAPSKPNNSPGAEPITAHCFRQISFENSLCAAQNSRHRRGASKILVRLRISSAFPQAAAAARMSEGG